MAGKPPNLFEQVRVSQERQVRPAPKYNPPKIYATASSDEMRSPLVVEQLNHAMAEIDQTMLSDAAAHRKFKSDRAAYMRKWRLDDKAKKAKGEI